ncbi:hypothetical protein AAVH_07664 [Aphelenchoides avenae]|nr:hypothetical protein AAVH_07664 [Aphelenchus avenae]
MILVGIDVLIRMIYAEPVKSKRDLDVRRAFEAIFQRAGKKPWRIWTDKGNEFESAAMKKYFHKKDILKYVAKTNKIQKAAVAERANRTLRERLYKFFSERNTVRWIVHLQDIVTAINSSVCRSTGMHPVDINEQNAPALVKALYPFERNRRVPKFQVGDCVRIQHLKKVFVKGLNTYTDKVFTITHVLDKHEPVLYKLQDFFERKLDGSSYERELVKVPPYMENSFRVERILQEKVANGQRQYLIKWMDHANSTLGSLQKISMACYRGSRAIVLVI